MFRLTKNYQPSEYADTRIPEAEPGKSSAGRIGTCASAGTRHAMHRCIIKATEQHEKYKCSAEQLYVLCFCKGYITVALVMQRWFACRVRAACTGSTPAPDYFFLVPGVLHCCTIVFASPRAALADQLYNIPESGKETWGSFNAQQCILQHPSLL